MLFDILAAAGGKAAPQTQFGFWEAMEQGGVIAWTIFGVLVILFLEAFLQFLLDLSLVLDCGLFFHWGRRSSSLRHCLRLLLRLRLFL